MIIMSKIFILVGLIFMLHSCERKSNAITRDEESVRKEARSMLHTYLQDMNSKGLLSEFEYLDESEDFFWVPPGYKSKLDYDSVKSILLKNAPVLKSINNQWSDLEVYPLSAEHCTYTGEIHSLTVTQNNDTTEVDMLETGVLVRRDDGWKILCGQSRIKD